MTENKGKLSGLLPMGVFLVLYIGAGILFRDFYKMPAVVAFLIALTVAFLQRREVPFQQKMKTVAGALGDDNLITMCLIFLVAGGFSGLMSAVGAVDSTVNLTLSLLPAKFAVMGLFLIGCFISTAMGTSVGTIVTLAPIAVSISEKTGFAMPLCIAAVSSGAMFGDNLSMISDTTIAAVRTQGCQMRDKFRMNFFIVLPAAIVSAVFFLVMTMGGEATLEGDMTYNVWHVVPYLVVLVGALAGVNIFVVLALGIVVAGVMGVAMGTLPFGSLFTAMGDGVMSMYDITVISIVVCCIGTLMKAHGGTDYLVCKVTQLARGKRGAQLGIGALVMGLDVATANNTIAIMMTGPLAREISEKYHISPERTASLLDIFASVVQGLLPYGAQLLYASAAAQISAMALIPYMVYPMLMAVCAVVAVLFFSRDKRVSG